MTTFEILSLAVKYRELAAGKNINIQTAKKLELIAERLEAQAGVFNVR